MGLQGAEASLNGLKAQQRTEGVAGRRSEPRTRAVAGLQYAGFRGVRRCDPKSVLDSHLVGLIVFMSL